MKLIDVRKHNKKVWLFADDVSTIFKKTPANIAKLKSRGKIEGINDPEFNEKGRAPIVYSWDSLVKHFGDPGIKINDIVKKDKKGTEEKLPEQKADFRAVADILGLDGDMRNRLNSLEHFGKGDIEKLVKLEDAIKKTRSNLAQSGKLIDIDTIEGDLSKFFSEFFSMAESLVDSWKVKFKFSDKQAEEMLEDYKKLYSETWQKIKGVVNAQGVATNN